MDPTFGYVFPAIRGIQAQREYFVSMCPLRLIPRIFSFDEEVLGPELRAQRTLNKARVPEIAEYVLSNRKDYVFSAITASVDAEVSFEPMAGSKDGESLGLLRIPMDARFIINDGQHRRAAIEEALRERPDLGDETLAVVFFLDVGLHRCQQMFADLNRYAIRPSTSIGVLYDHRDAAAQLVKQVAFQSSIFRELVELEKTTLSPRSRKLFTLSALYGGTKALLNGHEEKSVEDGVRLAIQFWEAVAEQLPEWRQVRERKISAGEVRRDFIHTHGIVLQALGRAGNALTASHPKNWKQALKPLGRLDWSRQNTKVWEGRTMQGGRISKSSQGVILTTNVIKKALDLKLSAEESRLEEAYKQGELNRG